MTRRNETTLRRNLGIIAHVDAGKTTLTERVLFHTGRIHRHGDVDSGNTRTDHRAEEQAKGITITSAAVTCEHRGHTLTLIDTPGHADFTLEVERSLRVLDGAVVLLDGVAGVEPQTEKVWRQADRHGVARIAFVNKLDRAGADLGRSLDSIRERLGAHPVPLVVPVLEDGALLGLIDVLRRRLVVPTEAGERSERPVPEAYRAEVESAHASVVEACAGIDDRVLEAYLEERNVATETLVAVLRRGVATGALLPTLAGSAQQSQGVHLLLDAVVDYLPAPEEGRAPTDIRTGAERPREDEAPLAALCFKVDLDSHGSLAFLRVFSGVLRRGDVVGRGADRARLRVGRLVRLFADLREDVDEVRAGDIAALVATDLRTGETLSALDARMLLEPVETPEPVIHVAIEPRGARDRDRLSTALARLSLEDPSIRVQTDPETGQTTLGGMGQLHLEVSVSRLRTAHGVEVQVGRPQVAFRETIRVAREVTLTHRAQRGGPGQFAHVVLRLEPAAPGTGFVFEDRTRGGAVPKEYVKGVIKGCRSAMTAGVVDGYPVVDVLAILVDGSTHPNDSSELAFEVAGRLAFQQASREAEPVLLEPLMRLEVDVPSAHVGDVVGDLGARRGRVLELHPDARAARVVAEVPLAELFGYATDLSSLSHGRGTQRMVLERYAMTG
ncbi:MAG: elongation factor G [Sandaracinaceae bacterium]